jgi:hypothetical protein
MEAKPDRPQTIAGLTAKHAELRRVQRQLQADLRAVQCDLDHLAACLRIFRAEGGPRARRRYAIKFKASRGQTHRYVLGCLREAAAPLTSRQMAEMWAKAQRMEPDAGTVTILRKRIGVCLIALRAEGLAEDVGHTEGDLKLWRLKAPPGPS